MRNFFYSAILVPLFLGGCTQEDIINNDTAYTLTATIEGYKSRTVINKGVAEEGSEWTVGWMDNDQLRVAGESFTMGHADYIYNGIDGALAGQFTTATQHKFTPKYAFYPSTWYDYEPSTKKVTVELQGTYKSSDYGYNMATVGNIVDGNKVEMHHLRPTIRITLPECSGYERLRLTSTNNVCGKYEILFDENGVNTTLGEGTNTSKSIDVIVESGTEEIYIAILPGSQQLSFDFIGTDGSSISGPIIKDGVMNYETGNIYEYDLSSAVSVCQLQN